MATLKNKRKLAAVARETEEHPRNGQPRNMFVPKINEEYITQVSGEIEGRFTRKLSQEFSRTNSRILGVLSKVVEFVLSPQVRTHSGTVPGTTRSTDVENQEPNGEQKSFRNNIYALHCLSHNIVFFRLCSHRIVFPQKSSTKLVFWEMLVFSTPKGRKLFFYSCRKRARNASWSFF